MAACLLAVRGAGYIRSVPIRRDRSSSLCVIDPACAIRAIADSLGRDARRSLVELVIDAWVEAIPDGELAAHYAKALAGLAPEDLREIAGWPGSSGVALANRQFLLAAFSALGEMRREALRLAATLRGDAAFDAGVSELQILNTVLPSLAQAQLHKLARATTELYLGDRLGGEN